MANDSQQMRNQLEKEKDDLQSGLISTTELRKKDNKQIRSLATHLGIDLKALEEKAKLA